MLARSNNGEFDRRSRLTAVPLSMLRPYCHAVVLLPGPLTLSSRAPRSRAVGRLGLLDTAR
eukprot:7344196-Pyramimonas_sp.AAC.1